MSSSQRNILLGLQLIFYVDTGTQDETTVIS